VIGVIFCFSKDNNGEKKKDTKKNKGPICRSSSKLKQIKTMKTTRWK
jgi:hypothetical protein